MTPLFELVRNMPRAEWEKQYKKGKIESSAKERSSFTSPKLAIIVDIKKNEADEMRPLI
ncbi:hypothetical protein D3C80_2031760 [compost metagenome]